MSNQLLLTHYLKEKLFYFHTVMICTMHEYNQNYNMIKLKSVVKRSFNYVYKYWGFNPSYHALGTFALILSTASLFMFLSVRL